MVRGQEDCSTVRSLGDCFNAGWPPLISIRFFRKGRCQGGGTAAVRVGGRDGQEGTRRFNASELSILKIDAHERTVPMAIKPK